MKKKFHAIQNGKAWVLFGGIVLSCLSQAAFANITGKVFRDFNANGTFDTGINFNEVGMAGITVKAFDSDDPTATPTATTTSLADGSYTLTGLASGADYRVEFSWAKTWLKPGASGGTSVQFVKDGATAVNFAVHDPNDYWDNTQDPRYTIPQYWNGLASANSTVMGVGSTPYSSTGLNANYLDYDDNPGTGPVPRADLMVSQVGTVWGEAYHKSQKHLYFTTFLKRHSGMADGPGYIYNVDYSGATPSLAGKFNLHGVVPANGGSAIDLGVVTRSGSADFTLPADKSTPNRDMDAFGKVGAMSYGDADIQPGTNYLWTVNLFQKALIRVDVSGNPTSVPSDVRQYVLNTLPGYPTSSTGVLRPWGLSFSQGKGYLGVVDDASLSALQSDLKAIVLEFDPNNITAGFTQKLSFDPNLKRQIAGSWIPFFPWVSTYAEPPVLVDGDYHYRPQPVLSDMEFDENGNMYVSFFDRWGHQMGYWNYRPISGDTTTVRPAVYGEILKACSTASGWEIEGTGTCHLGTTEFIQDISGDNEQESSEGAVALLKGKNQLLQVSIDPHPQDDISSTYWTTQGANTYNLSNGQISNWYSFFQSAQVETYGKANGLGDVELIVPPAPVEIGNRVWHDIDSDGIQDADEPGIDSVEVKLFCGTSGTEWATTTTANGGLFRFTNAAGGNAPFMDYGEDCTLWVDNNQMALSTYSLTVQDADNITDNNALTDLRDSDAATNTSMAEIKFTVGKAGENNHTLDFGYKPTPNETHSIGNRVWFDTNNNGMADVGESPVGAGIKLELKNAAGDVLQSATTDASGHYVFAGLTYSPSGYKVCLTADNFTAGGLLENHESSTGFTDPNATAVDGDDSGDDESDGVCSTAVMLEYNEPTGELGINGNYDGNDGAGTLDFLSDLTVDFGIVPPTDLKLTKTVDKISVHRGDTLIYTLTLTNESATVATSVKVADVLPAKLEFVDATPSQGSFTGSTWDIGTLAGNTTVTLLLKLTVK